MPGPHKIYYGNSGAEAIECALKLARYHIRGRNIIAFFGAFHGRTMGRSRSPLQNPSSAAASRRWFPA